MSRVAVATTLLVLLGAATVSAQTATTSDMPTARGNPLECRATYAKPECYAQRFSWTDDLGVSSTLIAKAAVAKDALAGFPTIHAPAFVNDGYYGNGSSWISASAQSWVKIDLGRPLAVSGIKFGRDRTGFYDDRDPGAFVVQVALWDNVYASGDDTGDAAEYRTVYDSAAAGFDPTIVGKQTIVVSFPPVNARFVKLRVAKAGAAIDEIEVAGMPAGQCPTGTTRAGGFCLAEASSLGDGQWVVLEVNQFGTYDSRPPATTGNEGYVTSWGHATPVTVPSLPAADLVNAASSIWVARTTLAPNVVALESLRNPGYFLTEWDDGLTMTAKVGDDFTMTASGRLAFWHQLRGATAGFAKCIIPMSTEGMSLAFVEPAPHDPRTCEAVSYVTVSRL